MANWHWSVFASLGLAALGMHWFFASKFLDRDRYDHVLSVELILMAIAMLVVILGVVCGLAYLVAWFAGWV